MAAGEAEAECSGSDIPWWLSSFLVQLFLCFWLRRSTAVLPYMCVCVFVGNCIAVLNEDKKIEEITSVLP